MEVCIPKDLGSGQIEFLSINSDIYHLRYKLKFKKEICFKFIPSSNQPLRFIYCVNGNLRHSFDHYDTPYYIEKYKKLIVAGNFHTSHTLAFPNNQEVDVFVLEIDRQSFQNNFDFDFLAQEPELYTVFKDVNAISTFYHNGHFGLQIMDILTTIINCGKENSMRALYVKGKLYELLTLQLEQYHDEIADYENTAFMSYQEIELTKKAVQIIKENLESLPTIAELATQLNTNTNKIQDTFKMMFHCTVNEYIQEHRLNKAKHLFLTTDHNISEICHLLGIQSRSYFSKVFKEKYGVTPSVFKKQKSSHFKILKNY